MRMVDRASWLFLAGIMAFSGIDKLVHYDGFVNAINNYRILPFPVGALLAPVIISAELMIAVGLSRKTWRRPAALQAAVLLVVLTVGWMGNRLLGSRGICGCWFSIDMGGDWMHLALNLLLIALSFLVWAGTARAALDRLEGEAGTGVYREG